MLPQGEKHSECPEGHEQIGVNLKKVATLMLFVLGKKRGVCFSFSLVGRGAEGANMELREMVLDSVLALKSKDATTKNIAASCKSPSVKVVCRTNRAPILAGSVLLR